ncbi:hypothetical protein KR093_011186 [Drosophila rubida]|uniref:Uncharacterized protein n=1 Tax=Drosophila rubida TaxID=30044 RepID=A0AAD4PG70_9MUSC|nr:hypothetical protein KR093_011186 [Drosophila rubida]
MPKLFNAKSLICKSFQTLRGLTTSSATVGHQLQKMRAKVSEPYFSQRYVLPVRKRQRYFKNQNNFRYVRKMDMDLIEENKKRMDLGYNSAIAPDYISEKERIRWSEFRRKMVFGSFAV